MSSKKGVIYILTNPSFEEYVKIGYATNIEERLKQLNRSEAVPFAFRVYAVYEVEKELSDKILHSLIDKLNPNLRAIDKFDGKDRVKEFYAMDKEDAYELLECIAKISGTEDRLKRMKPEGHEIEDEQIAKEVKDIARRSNFNFKECGIPEGSEIVFTEDPTIKAKVVDERHIKYGDGEPTSVSALAKDLKGCDHPVQGTLFFKYGKETLDERRRRLEEENNKEDTNK